MPVLTGGQVLEREGGQVMPCEGGALLEGGQYNIGEHGLIEEAEEPVMGMGPYKYSGVPPNGYKNGIAEKGAYLVDILTGDTYRNTGTKAATVWTADASAVAAEVTFTETAGAGTYTGAVALPAGATILDIVVTNVAQWTAATSAVMQVGDAGDAAGFTSALDLKAAAEGAVYAFGSLSAWGAAPGGAYIQQAGNDGSFLGLYSAGARTITGTVVTVGGGGTAGRTRLVVSYAAATPAAATKG